jgi:magnesium-transporting ATPase (P-type)
LQELWILPEGTVCWQTSAAGFDDLIREVKEAMQKTRESGIKVVMITGDSQEV